MSAATSPVTCKAYGVQRVCGVWSYPRSSFYAHGKPSAAAGPSAAEPLKRGPKPAWSDKKLLELIKADLEDSPFTGEGYRKVWARLKVQGAVRTSPKRVLRLMRENSLLSPHRARKKDGRAHKGQIITHAPNLMWGTDGSRVFTLEEGWVWIFVAVDHWNAECMGWHVCKRGDRFAALEPVSMGLSKHYGSLRAGAARGLALRMDHGTQYLSDHFQNQIKYWGIAPSFAFVEQPQTNGVAERFNRTLKEQAIYGRVFKNVDELRKAVGAFVRLYNEQWLVAKLKFKSPCQAREDFYNNDDLAA